jgi:hypothetical protein
MEAQSAVVELNFWLSVAGIVAGVVSVILAVVAIVLSALFFGFSSRAQTGVTGALEGIRGQTETLAKISSQQLTRLTKIVSDQVRRPQLDVEATNLFQQFADAVASLQTKTLLQEATQPHPAQGVVLSDHGIPLYPPEVDVPALKDAALTSYYALYYYTAYANFFAQAGLPSIEDFDETNPYHRIVRQLLDLSAADFQLVANALDGWATRDSDLVRHHRLAALGLEGQLVRDLVRSSSQEFVVRQQSQTDSL